MTRDEALIEVTNGCRRILAEPTHAVVIDRPDDSFIQLQAGKWESPRTAMTVILLDLPAASLADEQMERARAHFGIGPSSRGTTYDGVNRHMAVGWMIDCGTDAEQAAQKALAAFEAVYLPPPWPEYGVHVFEGSGEGWERLH